MPESDTFWGLLEALSATVTAALLRPVAFGVKVTVIVHVPVVGMLAGQLLVSAKSPGFVPVIVMLVIASVPPPLSVRVMFCAALVVPTFWVANVRDFGLSITLGSTPEPVRLIVCGLPIAVSVTWTEALRPPVARGANVTVIVHLAPAFNEDGQLFVCAKSVGFAPVILMLLIVTAAVPVLVRVATFDGLVAPTFTFPKFRDAGESVTVAAGIPVPVSPTLCGLPIALSLMVTNPVNVCPAAGVKVTLMVQLAPAASVLPHVLL